MTHDDGLLEELLRTRRVALAGYAYLLTMDRGAAEDLLHDALIRTFSRARSLRDVHAAEAYVRAAIRSAFLDGLRRTTAWRARLHLFAVPPTPPAPDDTAAAGIDVRAALAALPARERACVVLRYMDDQPVAQIARELGVSEGAVKRYLSDGTRALRERLGDTVSIPDVPGVETVPITAHDVRSSR